MSQQIEREQFLNRLRIMLSIDKHELDSAGVETGFNEFRSDPFRFLLKVDDDTAAKIFTIIEARE